MTTPRDDDLRNELLDVPDHGPEFWSALDAGLADAERENVVPLAAAPASRSRSRGVLLAAAVLVVLGGIGAWFAFGGESEDEPKPVTVAPEDVPEAVRFQFRWIDPGGDLEAPWSTMAIGAFGDYRVDYPDGSAEGSAAAYAWQSTDVEDTGLAVDVASRYAHPDGVAQVFQFGRRIGLRLVEGQEVEERTYGGRDSLEGFVDGARVIADAATWLPVFVEFENGRTFEVRAFEASASSGDISPPVVPSIPADYCCRTMEEASEGGWPAHTATWLPPGFSLDRLVVGGPEDGITQTYRKPWRLVEVRIASGSATAGRAGDLPRATSTELEYPTIGRLYVSVSGDVHVRDLTRILDGLELNQSSDRNVEAADPAVGVQSVAATVERSSATGVSGTFALVADQDGTVILKSGDADFGYHAPSGAAWSREGDTNSVNEIDPIHGRSRLESLLYLDLAEAVRYGGLGTAADRDGRSAIEATVELADNESAGWFDRTATITVDFQTGFVLDATITDASGEVVEELHLTDIEWSDEPAGISGAVVVDSDWIVTGGLPAQPVVADRYLVPEGIEPVRTFTTTAPVQSGSEAGNPEADGAYVIDVTTAPWRHSKIVVLGRTDGGWQDPLAEEGWFTEPTQVKTTGVLAGPGLVVTATPPVRPRALVRRAGLGDRGDRRPGRSGHGPASRESSPWQDRILAAVRPAEVPAVTPAPDGAESAFSIVGVDGGGMVVARRVADGPAAGSPWRRAVDEIWWESDFADPTTLDTGGAHAVVLLDAFVEENGEIAVIYGEVPSPDEPQPAEADLWLQRFGQSRSEAIALGWFTGAEYGVDAASRGGDRIAISAGADLGEVFSFYDLDGNEIDEPNNPVPVGHRYNEPPWYQHVALAPDGRTLAFVEGPDWDRDAQATIGDHSLVVVDLETGDEMARISLFERGAVEVGYLDFDGTWAVVSRQGSQSVNDDIFTLPTALAVNVADGTVDELPDTSGIVTLTDAR